MDAITEILSSGAFTRVQADALRALLATVTGGSYDPAGTAAGLVAAHEAAADPHPDYLTDAAAASTYLTEAAADLLYEPIGSSGDVWSHVTLTSDQTETPGTTDVNITGMAFTPAANKKYLFEFRGTWRASSTAASCSPNMGITWPTGLTSGSVVEVVGCGNASAVRGGGITTNIGGHGMAASNPNTDFPVTLSGIISAGATPSGAVQLRMRTATTGAHTITMRAGSTLSWRELP